VLIVDDAMLDRDVMVRLLSSSGIAVQAVSDAAACMEALERAAPDLVLLDLRMPDLGGVEVLKLIRQRWSPEQLPVIMVSGRTDSEDVVASLHAGANDYVLKPVNLPVLMARMGVALKIKRSVERLLEAELHREKLRALGDACDQLAAPMGRMVGEISELIAQLPAGQDRLRQRLDEIRDLAQQAAALIARFQALARYRMAPYTEGLGSFVNATMEQVKKGEETKRRRDEETP
jgi:CheY-like chemotaxis protein